VRSRAEDCRPRAGRRLLVDELVGLDGFAGQGVMLRRCERLPAGLAELVMAPAGERPVTQPEAADQRLARRYVAEIPVEQRHGCRYLADKSDRPVNGAVERWIHV
jgi:hypothetical protein